MSHKVNTVNNNLNVPRHGDPPNRNRSQSTLAQIDGDNMPEDGPFFVKIKWGTSGYDPVLEALNKLNNLLGKPSASAKDATANAQDASAFALTSAGELSQHNTSKKKSTRFHKILSRKEPSNWVPFGEEVTPGHIGLINHGGRPKLLAEPGRYPGFPFRNWWSRTWCGTRKLSDTVIEHLGLIIVQASHNQAAVVSGPCNRIFVVKDGGFVATANKGPYEVLSVVDQARLQNPIKDRITGMTLGWTQEVKVKTPGRAGEKDQEHVVALFLDILANNRAVLQIGDELPVCEAGQHFVVKPGVTLRGLFTLNENQFEFSLGDIFTRDQVPVSLKIYLKWRLTDPYELVRQGYNTPFEVLRDKTQLVLTKVLAEMNYSSIINQLGPTIDLEPTREDSRATSTLLKDICDAATEKLSKGVVGYGIELKDFAIVDRQFKGEIAATVDKFISRAVRAHVEGTCLKKENENKVKQEECALKITEIRAGAQKVKVNADVYEVGEIAKAEAGAIRTKAEADMDITDEFARQMQLRRIDVKRISAYGERVVFVPTKTGIDGESEDYTATRHAEKVIVEDVARGERGVAGTHIKKERKE